MRKTDNIILADPDFRRRAGISHFLVGIGFHVEPVEELAEFSTRPLSNWVIFVHDEGQSIAQAIQHMASRGQWLPLIAYAPAPARISQTVRAVQAGAVDYLEWPFSEAEVRQAHTVAMEAQWAQGNFKVREAMALSQVNRLTRREREVLIGVADGLSNRLIGERLAISPRTVEIHRANMLGKIGASHTSEAIRIAFEASLTE